MLRKAVALQVGGTKGDLGVFYDRGIGVDRDAEKSFQYLLESFNEGSMFRIADLAHCYNTGSGVEKNPIKATEVYEQMMQAGTWHADFYKALYELRVIQGLGIEKDEARGKAIILNSTGTGNTIAWYALSECYRHGYGWEVNKRQAARFYHRALKCKNGLQGQMGSYEALGRMREIGEGVRACAECSSAYYLSAANLLSQTGQWKAARAFESGIGQSEDLQRVLNGRLSSTT